MKLRLCLSCRGARYETHKIGEGRAFVVTFKHTLNGVEEPSLYALLYALADPHHSSRALIPNQFFTHMPLLLPSSSCMSNDFNPDTDSPRTSICVTEMAGKGMCAKFDAAFDRFYSTCMHTPPPPPPLLYTHNHPHFDAKHTHTLLQFCVHQRQLEGLQAQPRRRQGLQQVTGD